MKLAAIAAIASLVGLTACSPTVAEGEQQESTKIMVFGAFSQPPFVLPQIETAAQAAVERVNSEGGIDGVSVQLVSCDDQGNPNTAMECGRQAVDEGVDAVVGTFSLFTDNILPVLTEAEIPFIGSVAFSELETTSENSFPIN